MGIVTRLANLLALSCALALMPEAIAEQTMAAKDGAAEELSSALAWHLEACAGGSSADCYAAGAQLYIGRGAAADVPGAVALFRQGCDLGDGDACLRLAAELAFPDFGAPDTDGALAAYARACEAGRAEGCEEAGIAPPAPAVAAGPERPADAMSVPVATAEADRDTAVIVTAFVPPPDEDPPPAAEPSFAAEALPDLDFGAAIAGPDTLPEAEAAAAEAGEDALTDAGTAEDSQPSEEKLLAEERWGMAEACGRSDLDACEIFAAWLRDGTGGEADPVRARRIFSVICTEGSVKGCYELAWIMYDAASSALEMSRARFLFSDTCKAGVIEACLQAGDMRRHGEGGPLDLAGAARFYGMACEAGLEPGCTMAADVMPVGDAITPKETDIGAGTPEEKAQDPSFQESP